MASSPIAGRTQAKSFVSGQMNYRVLLDGGREIIVKEPAMRSERLIGEPVGVAWSADNAVVLDAD